MSPRLAVVALLLWGTVWAAGAWALLTHRHARKLPARPVLHSRREPHAPFEPRPEDFRR